MAARTERSYLLLWMMGIILSSLLAGVLPHPWLLLLPVAWVGVGWHGSIWLVGAALLGCWLGAYGSYPAALLIPTCALVAAVLLIILGSRARSASE